MSRGLRVIEQPWRARLEEMDDDLDELRSVMASAKIDVSKFARVATALLPSRHGGEREATDMHRSDACLRLFNAAGGFARKTNSNASRPIHLLVGIARDDDATVARVFSESCIDRFSLRRLAENLVAKSAPTVLPDDDLV
jgi:hypothetical protein